LKSMIGLIFKLRSNQTKTCKIYFIKHPKCLNGYTPYVSLILTRHTACLIETKAMHKKRHAPKCCLFYFRPFFMPPGRLGSSPCLFFYKKALRPAFFFFAFSFLISLRPNGRLFSFLKLLEKKRQASNVFGSLNIRRAIKKKKARKKRRANVSLFFFKFYF